MSRLRWNDPLPQATDLPVLLPAASRLARNSAAERATGAFSLHLLPAHGVALLVLFLIGCGWAEAQVQPVLQRLAASIQQALTNRNRA